MVLEYIRLCKSALMSFYAYFNCHRNMYLTVFNELYLSLKEVFLILLSSSGEHTWLFTEPDPGLEVSISHTNCQADRTYV